MIQQPWVRKRLVLVGLALAIVATVVIILTRLISGPDADEDGAISRTASDHSPGSEVMLYLPGRDTIMVAVDEKALDELISAISTRGDETQSLIQSGRVLTVPNKTRARIIEASFSKLMVRIIEGDLVLREVWVPERWVR